MPDELVNVRYMVDDVEDAVAFYTAHFGFTSLRAPRPPLPTRARQLAAFARRGEELGRASHARRPQPGPAAGAASTSSSRISEPRSSG